MIETVHNSILKFLDFPDHDGVPCCGDRIIHKWDASSQGIIIAIYELTVMIIWARRPYISSSGGQIYLSSGIKS